MKNLISLLLVTLFFGCVNNEPTTPIPDSYTAENITYANVYSDLIELKKKYEAVVTENVEYRIEIQQKIALIDTLLAKTVKYQNKYIELTIINDEIKDLANMNEKLVRIVTEENESIKLKNDSMLVILNEEQDLKDKALSENKKLKRVIRDADKIIVTGVKITPYNSYRGFFSSKTKQDVTYKADKIKSIVISFVVPHSTICSKGKYDLSIMVYSTPGNKSLQEIVSINYTGAEIPISVKFDDKSLIYTKGSHKVLIKSNGIVVYEDVLILE